MSSSYSPTSNTPINIFPSSTTPTNVPTLQLLPNYSYKEDYNQLAGSPSFQIPSTPLNGQSTPRKTSMIRGSVAYVKILKNAESTKAQIQKQKDEKAMTEKEQEIFEQFHEYKHLKSYKHTQLTESDDVELIGEINRIGQINRQKQEKLTMLNDKLKNVVEANEFENNSMQRSILSMSRQNLSSWFDQEQLVYINSIYKMKKSLNSSVMTMKQVNDPIQIFEAIEKLAQNQQRISDMTEVQEDTTHQLEKRVEEIKKQLDVIKKERNEMQNMNVLFDKKFKNLELREINAQKKNEEAKLTNIEFQKDMEDIKLKGMIIISEKQSEKSDIYSEVKFLKTEITNILIQIDRKKILEEEQQKEIQVQEQREQELVLQLKESKHIVNYIDSIETLERLFLLKEEEKEAQQIDNFIKENSYSVNSLQVQQNTHKKRSINTINNQDEINSSNLQSSRVEQSNDENKDAPSIKRADESNNNSLVSSNRNVILDSHRNVLVERLNEFFNNHQSGIMNVIDQLSLKLETLKVMSQSLHQRYQELIEVRKEKLGEIRDLDELIELEKEKEQKINYLKNIEDSSQDQQPAELHQKVETWVDNNEINGHLNAKSNFFQLKKINSQNQFENQRSSSSESSNSNRIKKVSKRTTKIGNNSFDKNISGNNSYEQSPNRTDQELETNKDNNEDQQNQEEKEKDLQKQEEQKKREQEKLLKDKRMNGTVNQMQLFVQENSKIEINQIRSKIEQYEKFGFKVFLNQVETLFRFSQTAQDIAKKSKSLKNQNKALEKLGEDLNKFVTSLRKGVAVKRSYQKNKLFLPLNEQPQVIRREDAKKYSFMEPLAQKFDREKAALKIKEEELFNSYSSQADYQGSSSYMPTTVNEQEKKQNKIEKFLDLYLYAPLNTQDVQEVFLSVFPNSHERCELFLKAIKNDMFLSFFESKESIQEYLVQISEDFEDNEQAASLVALKKIYILKEESQKQHWKNMKEIFEHYLNFLKVVRESNEAIWGRQNINLKNLISNFNQPKEDSIQQRKYFDSVVDKIEGYTCETHNIPDPITENKAINIKDLEESAKEKANTDDLKKIIYKLANSETKKIQVSLPPDAKRRIVNQDDDEINLLDNQTKRQLMQQHMTEEEYIDHECEQVKKEIEGDDENLAGSKNFSIVKLTDKRDFYLHKPSTEFTYLKSFVESEKVIWKLRQLENKKPQKKISSNNAFEYLPKGKKIRSERNSLHQSKPSEIKTPDEQSQIQMSAPKKKSTSQQPRNNIPHLTIPQTSSNVSTVLIPISLKTFIPDNYLKPVILQSSSLFSSPKNFSNQQTLQLNQLNQVSSTFGVGFNQLTPLSIPTLNKNNVQHFSSSSLTNQNWRIGIDPINNWKKASTQSNRNTCSEISNFTNVKPSTSRQHVSTSQHISPRINLPEQNASSERRKDLPRKLEQMAQKGDQKNK